MEYLGKYAIQNGALIEAPLACLPINERAVQFGFGVYETVGVLRGHAVYLEEHLNRLLISALGVDLHHSFSVSEMSDWVDKLLEKNEVGDGTLRILLVGTEQPLIFLTTHPKLDYPESYYREGINVITYPGERLLPRYKTNSLLLNYLALRMAQEQEAFEALLVDREGHVLEGTRSNVFAFVGNVLHTADDMLVLEGVTRDKVIRAAKELGFTISYLPITSEGVLAKRYEELFISSTSMGALPIAKVDGEVVSGDFKRTLAIHQLIRQWEFESLP